MVLGLVLAVAMEAARSSRRVQIAPAARSRAGRLDRCRSSIASSVCVVDRVGLDLDPSGIR